MQISVKDRIDAIPMALGRLYEAAAKRFFKGLPGNLVNRFTASAANYGSALSRTIFRQLSDEARQSLHEAVESSHQIGSKLNTAVIDEKLFALINHFIDKSLNEEVPKLNPRTNFYADLGWDKPEIRHLCDWVEDEFDIYIPDTVSYCSFRTIKDLSDFLINTLIDRCLKEVKWDTRDIFKNQLLRFSARFSDTDRNTINLNKRLRDIYINDDRLTKYLGGLEDLFDIEIPEAKFDPESSLNSIFKFICEMLADHQPKN